MALCSPGYPKIHWVDQARLDFFANFLTRPQRKLLKGWWSGKPQSQNQEESPRPGGQEREVGKEGHSQAHGGGFSAGKVGGGSSLQMHSWLFGHASIFFGKEFLLSFLSPSFCPSSPLPPLSSSSLRFITLPHLNVLV